ncbi:MAG: hypothetical protein ACRC5A_03600 [Enterobacteriaceae bacterium]
MDPVTRYLATQGIEVTPAYFGKSRLEIGKRWEAPNWFIIYRVEGDELIICQFTSKKKNGGLSSAVKQFTDKLRGIRRHVPQIKRFRGLIIDDSSPLLPRTEMKELKAILMQMGAREEVIEGEKWLVY